MEFQPSMTVLTSTSFRSILASCPMRSVSLHNSVPLLPQMSEITAAISTPIECSFCFTIRSASSFTLAACTLGSSELFKPLVTVPLEDSFESIAFFRNICSSTSSNSSLVTRDALDVLPWTVSVVERNFLNRPRSSSALLVRALISSASYKPFQSPRRMLHPLNSQFSSLLACLQFVIYIGYLYLYHSPLTLLSIRFQCPYNLSPSSSFEACPAFRKKSKFCKLCCTGEGGKSVQLESKL